MPDDVPTAVEERHAALFLVCACARDHSGEQEVGKSE